MTETAPKPCPGCKSDAIVAGVGLITEFGPMTYSQVQCGQSTTGCGYKGPYGHDPDHAIRLHNLISRPQQSAEPVAEAVKYTLPDEAVTLAVAVLRAAGWKSEPLVGHPIAASPGPSELVEEMERLEVKYRAQCKILATGEPDFSDGIAAGKQECADDLRALITRHRGKS